MDIFNQNKLPGREKVKNVGVRDEEFKLFVERKMRTSTEKSRFAGYTDDAILTILEKEFTMYKDAAPGKKGKIQAKKSKIPSFASINTALGTQDFGTTFTTPQSDRIYVVTKGTWGSKSKNKVVKGFAPGEAMDKIKTYSKRTKVKHGGSSPLTLPKDERTPTMSGTYRKK